MYIYIYIYINKYIFVFVYIGMNPFLCSRWLSPLAADCVDLFFPLGDGGVYQSGGRRLPTRHRIVLLFFFLLFFCFSVICVVPSAGYPSPVSADCVYLFFRLGNGCVYQSNGWRSNGSNGLPLFLCSSCSCWSSSLFADCVYIFFCLGDGGVYQSGWRRVYGSSFFYCVLSFSRFFSFWSNACRCWLTLVFADCVHILFCLGDGGIYLSKQRAAPTRAATR